jgi:acylphosphatase
MNGWDDGRQVSRLVTVTGVVQGVGYRYWAMSRARELALSGWVRNMPDGSVELLLQGPEQLVDRMIELCGRGPDWASVRSVEVRDSGGSGPAGDGRPFRVVT